MANTMNGQDMIRGASGECYVIWNGKRIHFLNATKVTLKADITKVESGTIETTHKLVKTSGVSYSGSAEFHGNTDFFTEMILEFQDNGRAISFDMLLVTEDKTSKAGRRELVAKNCTLGSVDLYNMSTDDLSNFTADFSAERVEGKKLFEAIDGLYLG